MTHACSCLRAMRCEYSNRQNRSPTLPLIFDYSPPISAFTTFADFPLHHTSVVDYIRRTIGGSLDIAQLPAARTAHSACARHDVLGPRATGRKWLRSYDLLLRPCRRSITQRVRGAVQYYCSQFGNTRRSRTRCKRCILRYQHRSLAQYTSRKPTRSAATASIYTTRLPH